MRDEAGAESITAEVPEHFGARVRLRDGGFDSGSPLTRRSGMTDSYRGPSVTKKSRPIGSIVKDAPVGASSARICSSR